MYQFLATVLPSLIILYFFVTQDRFPEPKKNIIITFILGIFITLPAGFLNTFFIYYLYDNFKYENIYPILDVVIPGAGVEETLKFLIILLYCSRIKAFDEPMDGLVYGATAALGFAVYENFSYVYNAEYYYSTWQDIAWIRALLTVPMHACCGAMIGFSFSYYYFNNKNIIYIFLGLFIAIVFHATFNYGAIYGPLYLSDFVLIIQLVLVYLTLRNLKKKQKKLSDIIDTLHD